MKKLINPWLGLPGYQCFGCSPDNPDGLHMEFYEDGDDIVGIWHPDPHKQGWVDTLHGGIQCTLMDEVAAWVIARKLQTSGVTSRMETRFIRPLHTTDRQMTIRSRITDQKRNAVFLTAEIYDGQDTVCASAKLVYFVESPEKAAEKYCFHGCRAEGE